MALWKAMEKPRSPQSKLPFPESQTPYRKKQAGQLSGLFLLYSITAVSEIKNGRPIMGWD